MSFDQALEPLDTQPSVSEEPIAPKRKNSNLTAAKKAKNDEFYTRLQDIENELKHYKSHFKDKTVFCNCDDPEWSNFWQFFHAKFDEYGLKRLIATYYTKNGQSAGKLVCHEQTRGADGRVTVQKSDLMGDGDFRSPECVALLKESDIVCTNPPFSLFREYIAQLIEHNKKFLVIGDMNAITYKETFPLIQSNQLWLGVATPKSFCINRDTSEHKTFGNKCWFTNLPHKRRAEELVLFKTFSGNESEYPRYDNFDAINVDRTERIPEDYFGAMGVPISFLFKHNPDQFEVLGIDRYIEGNRTPNKRFYIGKSEVYARIVIKRKSA